MIVSRSSRALEHRSAPPTVPERRRPMMRRILIAGVIVAILVVLGSALRIPGAIRQGRQKTWFVLRDQTAAALNMVLSHTGAPFDVSSTHAGQLNDLSPLGSVDLLAWGSKSSLRSSPDALPSNVTVHRCGDYVFTYHGVDLIQASAELWLVIQCLDPTSNESCWQSESVFVGFADGVVRGFPVNNFPSELAEQNNIRVRFGLPPVPDPCTVFEESSP